jgi:hypothetical protein
MRRIGWGGGGRMALYFRIEKTIIVVKSTSQGYHILYIKISLFFSQAHLRFCHFSREKLKGNKAGEQYVC